MDSAATQEQAPGDPGLSFLLDTDICSAFMKGVGRVTNRFIQHGGRLYLPTVALGELYAWTLRANASAQRMQSLLDLLREVQVVNVDEVVARKFGEVRAWQLDHGFASPDLDCSMGRLLSCIT